MDYRFFLNELEVDEPIGFASLEISIVRDEQFHGVGFEAALSQLEFYGEAANFLRDNKEEFGIEADVLFTAYLICNPTGNDALDIINDNIVYSGRVNFGTYVENCGESCSITISTEEVNCIVKIRSRRDQDVDIDSNLAFDKNTVLDGYPGLDMTLTLPPVKLLAQDRAETSELFAVDFAADPSVWFDNVTPSGMLAHISPAFDELIWGSFGEYNFSITPQMYNGGANNRPPYDVMPPTVDANGTGATNIPCEFTDATVSFNISGTISQIESAPSASSILGVRLYKLAPGADGSNIADWTTLYSAPLVTVLGTDTQAYSLADSFPVTIEFGSKLYFSLFLTVGDANTISSWVFQQNPGGFLDIQASATCEETETKASMIYETIERIVEAISDGCATVYSSYFMRTDSQPYSQAFNGCGSLRMLMSGLKIRNAQNPFHFLSFQNAMSGLYGIDNIGFGFVVADPITGEVIVEIEAVDFFYSDTVGVILPLIPRAKHEILEQMFYSKIATGYNNWQIQNINGLDEFNSTREYRTRFETITNALNLTSDFVAGSYPFERTRQQSFAESGAADTSYDDETFVVCVKEDFTVEVGADIIDASLNLFSPETKYNARISPIRNLIRWYKSIANGYRDDNTDPFSYPLFFSSGTGNIVCEMELVNDECIPEENTVQLAENQDLFGFDGGGSMKEPYRNFIWTNEIVSFDYPLSLADYKSIKASPYHKVSYQCGDGSFQEGWIKELKYRPVTGIATFILIKKYLFPST